MKTFVYQPGVPIVYVDQKEDGQAISARQARYFPLGDEKNDKSLWMIPMVMRPLEAGAAKTENQKNLTDTDTSNTKDHVARLLTEKQSDLPLGSHWPAVVVNASGKGYYHTCYSAPLLKKLESGFEDLTAEEKLTITSDVSALTLSSRVPVEESYNFALNLPREKDPLVLADLVRYFYTPHPFMTGAASQPYEKLIKYMIGPLKARLGWTAKAGESEADTRLRTSVLDLLGTYGQDKETISEAAKLFELYSKNHQAVDANVIDSMLSIVTYNGGIKEYEQVLALYKNAANPEDRNRALFCLPGFRDHQLALRTLNFALSKAVRSQDGIELMSNVATKRETRSVGWPFIESHWAQIIAKYSEDQLRALPHAASNVETPAQEAEVLSWFTHHPLPQAQAAVARMEESMHLQLIRYQRHGQRIKQWVLKEAAKLPPSTVSPPTS